jgi:hypothetical protein
MARDGMSSEYREAVNALMRDAKIDSTTLTDVWKAYAAEETATS